MPLTWSVCFRAKTCGTASSGWPLSQSCRPDYCAGEHAAHAWHLRSSITCKSAALYRSTPSPDLRPTLGTIVVLVLAPLSIARSQPIILFLNCSCCFRDPHKCWASEWSLGGAPNAVQSRTSSDDIICSVTSDCRFRRKEY